MKATKAGIWIDHDHAYLIEFEGEAMKATRVGPLAKESKKVNLRFGERRMHATEQREQSLYYKEIIELIRRYKEVVLFGPGTARKELFNLLSGNHGLHHGLQGIQVTTVHTARLTPRQRIALVRKNFTPSKLIV